MLSKYNNLDFQKRGMYLDFDKDGSLKVDGEQNEGNHQGKLFLFKEKL